MPESSLVPAEANFHSVAAEPEESGLADLGSVPLRDPGADDKLQVGLALPHGAPGTSYSARAALEPSLTSGEILQTFTARCIIFSPRM